MFNDLLRKVVCALGVVGLLCAAQSYAEGTVNVYSARKEALILPLLERFTAQTGIETRLVTAKADALLARLQAEGEATPADVLITTDAGRLFRAKEAGVLQAVTSATLDNAVAPSLRDADNYWFGISRRARVIFYALDRVSLYDIKSYQDLIDSEWKNRICIRSSNNIYNQSLVASMLVHHGVAATEQWVRGLVANFARDPAGGDTDQLRAVAAGECDIAVANTYYYGRLAGSTAAKDREVAAKLGLIWPNQNSTGAHINVSGVGVVRHSANVANAIRLMEFMVTPESQTWYAEVNNEYPVLSEAPVSPMLTSFGAFTADTIDLTLLGVHNQEALQVMDRAGWK